ncbi:N-glycosyltransferase [Poriferisphaera corsica]|uniref:N-glycosyltransferase n=1 Tax=Poriferisphaera corsica TaxID=2528020 RepID=A0A517YWD4_9BACT|nr:glycosyltransferase [Poriferisphaera corsica]QDU34512.1 N-glycosyltransferase [Poriferisphaera corsica]
MSKPRVSILIPNYNNGKLSTHDQQHDLIGNLMATLHKTLKNEPMPFEIIAFDDGSTDDSLDTLRSWTKQTWHHGGPVLNQLIEAEHCGVLAVTANKLVEASSGDILVRLDGDVVIATENWVSKLCQIFDDGPNDLGVIGPKQLGLSGKLYAFGDWLLHPKGYHHIGAELDRYAHRQPLEVDHVMGCFYCCKREVHDQLGGYDEKILRGQTVDFGLRARLHGWRCWAVPHIEFQHCHGLRLDRDTRADEEEGISYTLDVFKKKWGFDRIAPDLDYVREHYTSTPLLWNANVFGINADEIMISHQNPTLSMDDSEWGRYANDTRLQTSTENKVQLIKSALKMLPEDKREDAKVGVIGNGAGVLGLIAFNKGINYTGTDWSEGKVKVANRCIESVPTQSNPKPKIIHHTDWRKIPLEDGSLDVVLLINVLDNHANPVSLINEAHRVLGDGDDKILLTLTLRKPSRPTGPADPMCTYTHLEIANQINATGGWDLYWWDPEQQEGPVAVIFKRVESKTTEADEKPEMVVVAEQLRNQSTKQLSAARL